VDVRRQAIGLVERAYANEPDQIAAAPIVAPDGDPAAWAARDPLPVAACGRCVDHVDLTRTSSTRSDSIIALSANDAPVSRLAPAAMTAVHEQWPGVIR